MFAYKRRAWLGRGYMRGRRRLWLSLLAVPLGLLAADTGYWRVVAGNLERGFANWVSVQKAHGWTEQNGRTSVGGWPFAAILVVPALSLTHGGSDMPGR